MYCPNCGVRLFNSNQKFCQNCGFELIGVFESIELKRATYENPKIQETIPARPTAYQKKVKISSEFGPYSKKSLAYSIISIGIIGGSIIFGNLFLRNFFLLLHMGFIILIGFTLIIFAIIYGTGFIFGIFGAINSTKARNFELRNDMEKVGHIFGILGIICNFIAFFLVAFVLPFFIFQF